MEVVCSPRVDDIAIAILQQFRQTWRNLPVAAPIQRKKRGGHQRVAPACFVYACSIIDKTKALLARGLGSMTRAFRSLVHSLLPLVSSSILRRYPFSRRVASRSNTRYLMLN